MLEKSVAAGAGPGLLVTEVAQLRERAQKLMDWLGEERLETPPMVRGRNISPVSPGRGMRIAMLTYKKRDDT